MEKAWRLILDHKNDGYYNMAVDEAILLNYPKLKIPTFRIYGWSRPFMTLGYNQNHQDVLRAGRNVPFVRRITGGSAILHHNEITYSITCSTKDLDLPKNVKESFKIICSFLKGFYRRLSLKAEFANDVFSGPKGDYSNFCFSNFQHFDILIGGQKIGGNAQRRRQNTIFQHGSIPQEINFNQIREQIIGVEDAEAKAMSLSEVLPAPLGFDSLSALLVLSFENAFGIKLAKEELTSREQALTADLIENKYKTKIWNFHRKSKSETAKFTHAKS